MVFIDIQFGSFNAHAELPRSGRDESSPAFQRAFQRRHRHPSSRSDGVNVAVGFNQVSHPLSLPNLLRFAITAFRPGKGGGY